MTRQVIGILGSIFAALCCVGTPVLLAFLASIGVGFMINDLILVPLLLVFLAISIWSMTRSMAAHGQRWPLILAVVSSVVTFAAVWFSRPLVLLGLIGLIAASAWDMYLHKTCAQPAAGAFESDSGSS